jgi:hypothetical protein
VGVGLSGDAVRAVLRGAQVIRVVVLAVALPPLWVACGILRIVAAVWRVEEWLE